MQTEGALAHHHELLTAELGVWRPPPRQHLLERQKASRLAAAEWIGEPPGDQRRRWITGDPTRHRRPDRPAEIARTGPSERIESLPLSPTLELPASRLRRKRRGLESLITELPSAVEKDPHDSNAP
ncbi:hypothetical protein [Imhoffiella purpurea]|uniref:Uncharacterized protein n=1 Tax=Imhoffiella purpurea TaxID=1249627 RepID=W9VQC6_9GAMM|nr:hypothetical protein [Imhoffiella purpurea]EXJ12655.1 hypothetical protein D779_4023 [Imhoffiella purpurea]